MTNFETVIRHINQGATYSWDLTVLLGLGLVISTTLRNMLLQSSTTTEDAALVTSIYTRNLLSQRTGQMREETGSAAKYLNP